MESDLNKYWLYRSVTSGVLSSKVVIATVTAPTVTYADTGLTNSTTYYYQVTALDTSDNESGGSTEASGFPTAPAVGGGNLLPDTVDNRWHYGFESSVLGIDDFCWEELGTAASIDGIETAGKVIGTRACNFDDPTTAYTARQIISSTVTVTAGTGYYVGIWAYVVEVTALSNVADSKIQLGIRWYDASDVLLSSQPVTGDRTVSAFATWTKLTFSTLTAPTGATQARFLVAAKELVANGNDVIVDDGEFIQASAANTAPNAPGVGPTTKTGQFQSDGTTNIAVGGEASATTVKLSAMISDPDSDTVKLELEIKPTATGFSNTANYTGALVASGSTQTITVSGLTEGVTYQWQARTIDSNAATSAWTVFNGGVGNHFIVFRTPPDTTPPADVTSFIATPGNTQATLGWTDPVDADLLKILIVRNETDSFTAPTSGTAYTDGAGTGPGGDWCENVAKAAETLSVTSLVNGTKYYFKAYSFDTSTNYATGVSTNVTPAAVNSAPTSPSALSPAAGAWTGDTTPTLSFTTDDPDNDNVKFYLQISSFSDFSTNAVYYVSASAAEGAKTFTVGQAAGTGQYITGAVSQTLGEDDGYYWRAWLEDSNGAFSSTATANGGAVAFGIDKTAPTNVGCYTPSDGATEFSETGSLVALTASDSVSGGVEYYFELDEVSTFDSGALANSGWLGGTSWPPTLTNSVTYYWRVQTRDAAGNLSGKYGHSLSPQYALTPPTIDGIISAGEWSNSQAITLNGFTTPSSTKGGTMYIMNDDDNMYVCIVIPDATEENADYIMLDFDNNHDHTATSGGEDAAEISGAGTYGDCYWNIAGVWSIDTTGHGAAAISYAGGNYTCEFSKPLNSGDSQDMTLNPGDTVGFRIETWDDSTAEYYRYPQNTVDYDTGRWDEWTEINTKANCGKFTVEPVPGPQGIWSEPFYYADNTSTGTGNRWTRDISACTIVPPDDWFTTKSGAFSVQDNDGWGIWQTEQIDIAYYDNISISFDLARFGAGVFAGTEGIDAYYSIDGGAYQLFYSTRGTFQISHSTEVTGLEGNTLALQIKGYTNAGTKGVKWDNVLVSGFPTTVNVPPYAPALTSPADSNISDDIGPIFTWTFSDFNSGDTQSAYQWVADNDSGFGSIDYDSGKTVTAVASYTTAMPEGTWYWKVKTWDASDLDGSYASYRTLIIDTTPPGAVVNLAASSSGSNIGLIWTPGTDAFTGVSHQALYRATFTITNQYAANVTVLSNSLAAAAGSYTDPAVNFGTTYYYVITAFDEATNESGISNCDSATPATIGDPRLSRTDYYCEPLFTPGNNLPAGAAPYMNQRLVALINSAQSRCYVAIYELTDDDPAGNSITDSLIARAAAIGAGNVKVITDRKNNATDAVNALKAAGITVKDDGTVYPVMNNKFAVIDGKYVWTGSADWTDSDGGGFDRHDNDAIIIQDEAVALAYENQFLDMFNDGKFHVASTRNGSKDVSGNNVEFYFTGSNAIEDASSFGLRYKVKNAAESCIGAIYIFTDSQLPSLEDDLRDARGEGQVVRLLFDTDQYSGSPYNFLDQLGMNVRLDNSVAMLKSKLMVIDQEIVATGSMDWRTISGGVSSDPTDENYLFIRDDILARQYMRYLMRLHELASDSDGGTPEDPSADMDAPDAVSNVYAYGSGSGKITVEFDASTDPKFSRYYIFISTLQNYANAMAVKQKFIDTGQTNLSDACDNDGDKAVDEEIFNGIDDDGDGLIDEDINILAEKVVKTKGEGTVQVELTTYSHGRQLDNNTTYWVCVLQTDKSGNESPASFADASEPTVGDSFYGYVSPGVPVPNTAPECRVASPSGWNGGAFDISATAWDNDGSPYDDSVMSVEFYYSTASASGPWLYAGMKYAPPSAGSSLAPSTGTYTYTWNSASCIKQDSTVWLRARAKDYNLHKYSAWSVSSVFSVDNQPPPAPSPDDGIAASGSNWTQDNNPIMSWTAVTDPGSGLHATEPYLVRYDTGAAVAQSGLTYTKTLSDGSHIFYVAAKDAAGAVGNISAYGNHSVNVDNTPPPATIVTDPPVVEFDRITIEWNSVTDATSGVLHYNVYRDVADIVSVAALTPIAQPTTTSYTDDSGLAAGVEYFYVVCAVDKAGNEASILNCVSGTAAAPPVKASAWHIPSSTTVVSGSHTYRDPAYEVHKGTKVYFYSKSAQAATQSGLTLYWGTDGASYSAAAGQYDSSDASYDFWYATVTITQSGGTTFYYYLAADYFAGADRTYLYDLYSNGISSTSAFAADAVSKPFKLYIINTPPPAPSLISPNGGEELFADDVWTITWSTVTDSDGDTLYYDIDYSVDGGVSWNGITGNAQGSSYAWTVENTPYEGALMRIRAYDGTDYSDFDESDSTFTISAVTTDHIVISEVCVGYGSSGIEYIELYNPTTYTWLLDGKLGLKITAGSPWSLVTKTAGLDYTANAGSNSIAPKGFFLITDNDVPHTIGSVASDCLFAEGMTEKGGIQILYNNIIIDRLAWGTTNAGNVSDCTETTRVSELKDIDSNWSMERKAYPNSTAESMTAGYAAIDVSTGADNNKGNAVDTDNNSADFVVHKDTHYFTPQNSLSAVEPPPNTSAPTLSGGSVSPAKGTTATSFSFSVNYTDLGNDRPTSAKVYIDGDAGHPMGSSDEVYDNGSVHTYATTLSAGAHEYYFHFSDGKYYARYPLVGVLTGPNVGPNLDTIEIIRPDTPADNENRFPGTVTFECCLSGGGAGDVNGYSSFEAQLKYSLNGGAYQTLAMTQDSAGADGNYFTVSRNFVAGDYVNFYFEGRDGDSSAWADCGGETSYFSVGLLAGWHYPPVKFKGAPGFPSTYRYPLIPLQTQTVDIFAGCEASTASVSIYYAVNALPVMAADGSAASGSVKIDIEKEFSVGAADDDREGNYFTTRVSTNPIPVQNDEATVYYFIKTHLTGYPTTYLIKDANSADNSHMTPDKPTLKTQCFSYTVGEVELIDAFHIASLPDNPSTLGMREAVYYTDYSLNIHTAHGARTETVNIYFGKNADPGDYDGDSDDLDATLYFRNCVSNGEEYTSDNEFAHQSTFTYYSTIGSTDYWHCSFVQPSDDSRFFRRDDIVEYYIELKKEGMATTVIYPGANNGAAPDDNSAVIAESIFEKTAAYNNPAQPKFWYQVENYPPVMQYALSPADYAENIPLNATGNKWEFRWEGAVDYDGDGIAQYQFQISKDFNFPDGQIISSFTVSGSSTAYTASGLYDGAVYYWRVKAKDSYGEWGDWCNNNSHWTFFSLGSARVSWLSMRYGPTGTENVMDDLGNGTIYTDITNSDAVQIKFDFRPTPAATVAQARVYYAISSSQFDPVVTYADSTNTVTNSFFFRAADFPNGNPTNYDSGNMTTVGSGGVSTVTITIPADVHRKMDTGSYFWVQPCVTALAESATSWINGKARCYAINENADKIVTGRGSKNSEFPANYSAAPGVGDSNLDTMVDNYTSLWHDPSAPLMPGYLLKNYLTPRNDMKRVNWNKRRLNSSNAYLTEDTPDAAGNPDMYYGEDPGIYMRTAYHDLGSGGLAASGCSVVMSYNNFATVKTAPLSYENINISTSMSPYELKYSFLKALESSDAKNMPENAEIQYYFKLSQGSSGISYLCKNGSGAQVVDSEGAAQTNPFTYHVLQDDYTRPFVWKEPKPYAVPGDSTTLCGRSVGYVMISIGLADTVDGYITPVPGGAKLGPFNTWPGGWSDAVTEGYDEYLLGDAINHAPFNSAGVGDYSEDNDGYFGNNVPAVNVSTFTTASGVVSSAGDNINYTDAKRWTHHTLCYFAYMATAAECDEVGFRNAPTQQLFTIASVDGEAYHKNVPGGTDWNPGSTISGVVEMAPKDAAGTEWYARIPVPPNVEEVPYLYYRIWACNGDADPQARYTERGGGGSTTPGQFTGWTGVSGGTQIDDPYLPEFPSGVASPGKAGGRYRDRDYGWVTRSLFAGMVAKPAQVRITAIVNYRNTRRQVTAFMKIDGATKRPAGILSIQVNTPKMLGD
ncbi:hypothetical protein KJ577_03765 [bacterium]|nr:hypothetical protein [bacterium]